MADNDFIDSMFFVAGGAIAVVCGFLGAALLYVVGGKGVVEGVRAGLEGGESRRLRSHGWRSSLRACTSP